MEQILENLSEKLKNANEHEKRNKEYSSISTDEERVKFTMGLIHEHNVQLLMKFEEKSASQSVLYRNEGNKLFTSHNLSLNKTIEMYTKSIAFAPISSKELSIAYANRSAALFTARLYNACLLDIGRALTLNYEQRLRVKLYARRVKCLIMLKKKSDTEVDKAIEEARMWLDKMDMNNPKRSVIEETLTNPEKIVTIETEFVKWEEEKYCPNIHDKNQEIIGASSAVELRYSDEFGKHILATRDIKPGEVLALEECYTSVLIPEKFYTNCSYCLTQTWSLIPCDACVTVLYCNDECKNAAWEEFHDIECKVIGSLVGVGMNNLGLMSLRLAVKALKEAKSFNNLKLLIDLADNAKDPRTNGFTDGKLDDTKYISVYTLARNTEKRSIPDLFGRSLNAVYIVYMLATRSKMFGKVLNNNLENLVNNQFVTFIGGLIMRHQQIIPSNVHSIAEENKIPTDPNERAAALMPFYSLFNHTCDPPVTRVSFGRKMALYAVYPIKKGEQIFDNYGMHYALHPKNYRLSRLYQQFRFVCNCRSCIEDWPTFPNVPSFWVQRLANVNNEKLNYAMVKFSKSTTSWRSELKLKIIPK
ncbi:SET and MYND domain-containing protein 4-like [Aphidius gifuensis]|uniref:SET and MYND domain-containing protein 4-like n=1 Tax=Aphidius gifuensis TaxID=684658 RepID=UPI001CDCA588|nr:SET and MYND domain-containing protein 4-like [Aphidius gifuensis]